MLDRITEAVLYVVEHPVNTFIGTYIALYGFKLVSYSHEKRSSRLDPLEKETKKNIGAILPPGIGFLYSELTAPEKTR